MDNCSIAFFSALWLGILTSISPCPLATNIVALSYISKKVNNVKTVFLSGLAYTAGRMTAYAVLGNGIIYLFLSVYRVANFFQKYANMILGPILILAGLFILDVFKITFKEIGISDTKKEKLANSGIAGGFLLGGLFALSFCPISAALFFGSLIPLSLSTKYGVILPFVYGIGTALPVFIVALCLTAGMRSFSKGIEKLRTFEFFMRKATGIIFIAIGLYYTWFYAIKPCYI